MSNFNQFFKNSGASMMVDRFFKDVDLYNKDTKITSLKHYIADEPSYPASYYIENQLTATHKVIIEYTLNEEDEIRYTEFEVPREIEGIFIIEGALRISTNRLGIDYDCRIRMSGTGTYQITFDYDRQYDITKRILKIKRLNQKLGVSDRPINIEYDEIESTLLNPKKKELLKLTEKQSKKFMIKLDLDYVPEYIDTKLIDRCLAFGDDRLHDLIIDKTLESVPTGFIQFIFRENNRRNFYSAKTRITSYFTKHGRLQEPITSITSLCNKFWRGHKDVKTSELQVPPGVNSMNLNSLTDKITVPESVAFNSTFADLIDIAETPINNSTNRINSLTISCHITDTNVLFDVYTKDFQKVTIDYFDYLNSKVVASEYVDYKTNTLLPNKDNEVEVKYRMKRRMVNMDEIDLIDLHPDYRLSGITRRIPFVNYTDSVRISMGTSMLKQSIPLINAERALVDTGNYEELRDNVLNEKFTEKEGIVTEITGDKVIIESTDGNKIEYTRRTALQSVNDVAVYTEPKVKVGQVLKEGDVVLGAVGHELDTYKAGINTLVLFHAYYGLVNEDALVISESYAHRSASYSIIDLMIDVRNTTAIKWIAPIGTKVKSGDSIAILNKAIRLDEINRTLNEKLGGITGEKTITDYVIENPQKVPNNIDEAVVSDILIQENVNPVVSKSTKMPDLTFTRTSEDLIKEYENSKNKARQVIYDKYPEYIASDVLDPINLNSKSHKVVYTIRVRLIKYSPSVIGEKITSRYGGKGVVSKVVPDEDMPIVVDSKTGEKKRAEVIMNPYSTIRRKIPSVLMELQLGSIAHRLYGMVEELKKTKTGQKKIIPLLSKYYPGRFDSMDIQDFLELHNNSKIEEVYHFNVGCFSSFTPDQVNAWADELNVESQSEVLMPETELTDLSELQAELGNEEFEKYKNSIEGKFIKVDKKLQAGYMQLERLYHIPSYSNKVTTSLFGVDVNPRRDEPIFGRGKYRPTGQVIGEQELTVLLSRNAEQFIEVSRKNVASETNQLFLNNLLGLGLTVSDSKGYNQGGSNLKGQLEKMKNKFRIKNNK